LIKPVEINEKTAPEFLKNLQNKVFMVCFVYYEFRFDDDKRTYIDVAKTKYTKNGGWTIGCRGNTYLDNMLDEPDEWFIEAIIKYVHSYIECEEPKLEES
jgi:hypothetical protein